ncbi:MAG: UDP-N-acetylmuramate--alanine ligase [Burkholderiales bacterium]|nr:UDP-N-acetylmuramate--alanine ligase [Burkholderiales bacterium]
MGSDDRDRLRIAQVAARLIAEHAIGDWSLAKRKAARQLMLGDRVALPADDEIQAALIDYHAIFGGEAHAQRLRTQRETALRWMTRLAAYSPVLVGGVAAGWATEHSDIHLELCAEDPKAVEIALLNAKTPYRTLGTDRDGAAELLLTGTDPIRLSIRTATLARQRSRRERSADGARLGADDLKRLLAS